MMDFQATLFLANGAILVLTNRDNDGNIMDYAVKPVDGKKIKSDTFYQLKNGKFVAVEQHQRPKAVWSDRQETINADEAPQPVGGGNNISNMYLQSMFGSGRTR